MREEVSPYDLAALPSCPFWGFSAWPRLRCGQGWMGCATGFRTTHSCQLRGAPDSVERSMLRLPMCSVISTMADPPWGAFRASRGAKSIIFGGFWDEPPCAVCSTVFQQTQRVLEITARTRAATPPLNSCCQRGAGSRGEACKLKTGRGVLFAETEAHSTARRTPPNL